MVNMESQNESIDISSIRAAALRPSGLSDWQPEGSHDSHVQIIQQAYKEALIAANSVQYSDVTKDKSNSASQPVGLTENQNTFPNLGSTIPETQELGDIESLLRSLPQGEQLAAIEAVRNMSSLGSIPQDTQQLSQSVFDHILRARSVQQSRVLEDKEEDEEEVDITRATLQEGDEGHVDLLSSYINHDVVAGEESDPEPIDFLPTQTQERIPQFPESQRFKTPATVGKKRDYNEYLIDSPLLPRNPLLRTGLPTPGKIMDMSQLFAATQAGSSPYLKGLPSELRSDRPSPNIEVQVRLASATSSSPLRPLSELRRTATEPQSHYISVKQSQAEREQQAEMRRLESENRADEESDDGFDDVSSLVERKQRQRERDEKARQQYEALTSPKRRRPIDKVGTVSSPTRRPSSSSPRLSPQRYGMQGIQTSPDQDDNQEERHLTNDVIADRHESEEDTEQEDEGGADGLRSSQMFIMTEENKENQGYPGMQVPQTVARLQQVMNAPPDVEGSPSVRTRSGNSRSAVSSSGLLPSEPFAIANSQPSQSDQTRTHIGFGNVTSSAGATDFVPQSQVQPMKSVSTTSYAGDAVSQIRMGKGEDEIAKNAQFVMKGGQLQLPAQYDRTQHQTVIPEIHSISKVGEETGKEASPMVSQNRGISEDSSRVSNNFETAETHISSKNNPILNLTHSLPSAIFSSPSGRTRRRMAEIAADPSPQEFSGSFGIDGAMITVQDKDFEKIMGSSSPIPPGRASKRRRVEKRSMQTPSLLPLALVEPDLNEDDEIRDVSSEPDAQLEGQIEATETAAMADTALDMVFANGNRGSRLNSSGSNSVNARPNRARNIRNGASIFDIQASPEECWNTIGASKTQKLRIPASTLPSRKPKLSARSPTRQAASQSARLVTPPTNDHPDLLTFEASKLSDDARVTPVGDVIFPNRAFAFFKGMPRGYYPATCLGVSAREPLRYKILWEGYDPIHIDIHGIRALDLRIGDTVKVALAGFPRISYVVLGLKDRLEKFCTDAPMTDIRGYQTLLVAPKQRKSLPAYLQGLEQETVKEVPIAAVYLDANMWGQMKKRTFEYDHTDLQQQTLAGRPGYETPLERANTPSTPSSRSRRQPFDATIAVPPSPTGIFANMAFAISYDDSDRKSALTFLIKENGGILLEAGFHELFDSESAELALKHQYLNLGFTLLVADRHSRKEKYMQALALGIPCLSGKWLEKCVDLAANKKDVEKLVSWRPYLLPAGDSEALEGATRSRIMPQSVLESGAEDVQLKDLIKFRPNVLNGADVIFVMGKGKTEDKRRPYLFLTQALGAGRIEKVVKTTKTLVEDTSSGDGSAYKWVFVDDRDVDAAKTIVNNSLQGNPTEGLNVAGNEMIVQSLILGTLYEP